MSFYGVGDFGQTPVELRAGDANSMIIGCKRNGFRNWFSVENAMRIPLYWSRATAEGLDERGRATSFSCLRSSDISADDARQSALAAATRVLQKLAAGKPCACYPYGDAPLREEVVQRFEDAQGNLYAAVTRNGYGSLVLNAARVMFIDIDFAVTPRSGGLLGFIAGLFGKSPSPDLQQEQEDNAKNRLQQLLDARPGWGIRIYRTRAGIRGLVTHDLFDPTSDAVLDTLRAVGADPLYVRLCKAQECFRARLTPKPWRCGHNVNRTAWPRESEKQQRRFDKWLAAYMSRQSQYATCRPIGTLGSAAVHPDVQTIVEVHDEITRCNEPLELA